MLRRRAATAADMALSPCSTLLGIGQGGRYPPPPPPERHDCRCLVPPTLTIKISHGRRNWRSTCPPSTMMKTFLPHPYQCHRRERGITTTETLHPSPGSTSSSRTARISRMRLPLGTMAYLSSRLMGGRTATPRRGP